MRNDSRLSKPLITGTLLLEEARRASGMWSQTHFPRSWCCQHRSITTSESNELSVCLWGRWRNERKFRCLLERRNGKFKTQERDFSFNEVLSAWMSAQGLHFCVLLCFDCWITITAYMRFSPLYKWGISVLGRLNNLSKVTCQLRYEASGWKQKE